jgi:hypothetical protein
MWDSLEAEGTLEVNPLVPLSICVLSLLPASCWFLAWFTLQLWRWWQHIPLKCWLTFSSLLYVISQKIELFILSPCFLFTWYTVWLAQSLFFSGSWLGCCGGESHRWLSWSKNIGSSRKLSWDRLHKASFDQRLQTVAKSVPQAKGWGKTLLPGARSFLQVGSCSAVQ